MSFNRSGYIGRAPGDSAITISKQYFQPTGVTTDFTFSSGYDPGLIDVYRNGIKLINVLDYAATDGSTISLSTPVGVGSTVQVVAYKAYNVATVKATELDTTVTGSTINLTGDITATNATISALTTTANLSVSVAATVSSALHVGSALTANAAGDVETIGIITASSFSGDGTNISGVVGVGTLNVRTESLTVSGVSTLTGVTNVTGAANFASAVNVDATTDSTSSTTGALIVDGGVGIAKNVYIGAGLSVAGTLTYEDVTSVDSVGMVTAKSGVNITGGQLTVGSGITMGIAGVATFSGTSDVHLLDNVRLNVGDGSDLAIYHDGSNSFISDSGTGGIKLMASDVYIKNASDADMIHAQSGGAVKIYHNGNQKFETTNDGTVTTGISTVDGLRLGDNEYISVGAGGTGDLQLSHNGSHSYINHGGTGDLWIRNTQTNGDIYIVPSDSNGAFVVQSTTGEVIIQGSTNGDVELYYNNSKKFETTNDGTVTTGIGTFSNGIRLPDDVMAKFGTDEDLKIRHQSGNSIISHGGAGDLLINTGAGEKIYIDTSEVIFRNAASNETLIKATENSDVELYFNDSLKLATTNEGAKITGFTSTTAGMGVTGGLFEGSFIKAGKLSDNATLGISTANFFYFTTQETTTATPNIVWNDSYSLSSKMAVGDVASVTVVTTAAAGGYAANWTIDGNAVTEEWVGGSAPSAGGADGLDIYSLTIIKTGTGTGDSGFKVIGNLSNAT